MLCTAMVMTLAFVLWPDRYATIGDELLSNHDFMAGTQDWSAAGPVELDQDTDQVRLHGVNADQFVTLSRRVKAISTYSHMRITLRATANQLDGNNPMWAPAGVAMHSFNVHGQRLWYWPWRIISLTSGDGWQTYEAVIPIAEDTEYVWLFVYILSHAGNLDVDSISASAVEETLGLKVLRGMLVAAWALAIVWAVMLVLASRVAPSARMPDHAPSIWHVKTVRALAAAIALTIVVGGVLPHPHLARAVGSTKEVLGAWTNTGAGTLRDALTWVRNIGRADVSEPSTADALLKDGPDTLNGGADDLTRDEQNAATSDTAEDAETPPAKKEAQARIPSAQTAGQSSYAHFGAFLVLAMISALGWRQARKYQVVCALVVLSASVQMMQVVPVTREPELLDAAFDWLGIACGFSIGLLTCRLPWLRQVL
jgi:hypothetical protein